MRKLMRSTTNERGLGRPGIQKALAVTLAAVFLAPSVLSAAGGKPGGPRPEPTNEKPTVRERVLKIPAGAIVVVRLRNKEKVKGRMGEVTNEAFTVQTAKGNEIEKRTVSFADVKSIKTASTTGHKVGLGLTIAGVTVGAIFLGILIYFLAGGAD
jgi:hypothetical protein